MARSTRRHRRRAVRLIVIGLAGSCLVAGSRPREEPRLSARIRARERTIRGDWPAAAAPPSSSGPARRSPLRRVAAALALTLVFFTGASMTAIAGDQASQLLADEVPQTEPAAPETETTPTEPEAPAAPPEAPAPTEPPAPATEPEAPALPPATTEEGEEPAPVEAPAPSDETPEEWQTEASPATEDPAPDAAPDAAAEEAATAPAPRAPRTDARAGEGRRGERSPARRRPPVIRDDRPPAALDPEVDAPGALSTVWLNRTTFDPMPRSLRLSRRLAGRLLGVSRAERVDWALVLAVLRANGNRRPIPARSPSFLRTARRLAELGAARDPWAAVLGYGGRTAFADRAVALARYYRAVGLRALVRGLRAERGRLARRLLDDPKVMIYAGGRADLEAGRVDVRIVALLAYLRRDFGQVTVSSLISGHRLYSRPGVISAHVYGQAVDIAALGGVSILGHQGRGSLAERAVRDILLLPAEMLPRQVISLMGLGGPSFPLADHHDHIHVGY